MKEWLITDTHFDHDNIGVYCDRPKGWMDRIIRNWKQIVKPDDVVLHLGDVLVGNRHSMRDLMNGLPGHKLLIRGNHDDKSSMWYIRNGFAFACDGMAYKGVTWTHRPSYTLMPDTDINIHGHVHNTVWNPRADFSRLLAIEHVGYKPIDLMKWVGM